MHDEGTSADDAAHHGDDMDVPDDVEDEGYDNSNNDDDDDDAVAGPSYTYHSEGM